MFERERTEEEEEEGCVPSDVSMLQEKKKEETKEVEKKCFYFD
jgi:hypothetical protein